MADRATGLFTLGQTAGVAAGKLNSILGEEAEFVDFVPPGSGQAGRSTYARKKRCRLMRNSSGGALLPGTPVTVNYATNGLPGLEVSGACAALDRHVVIVDEWLPAAGVADGDIFWATIKGPTKVTVKTGVTIAAGGDLCPAASGTVDNIAAAPATDPAAQEDALSRFAVALEGVTTAGAGAQILCDVDCHA